MTLAKGKILRPFLNTRRAEIEAFLNSRSQPWREDSSNSDTAFTRNKIRHELLPQMRGYNPNLDQTLANLAELAREEEARWQAELGRILPQLLLPGDRFEVGAALSVLRRVKVRSRSSLTGFGRSILRCGGGFFGLPPASLARD